MAIITRAEYLSQINVAKNNEERLAIHNKYYDQFVDRSTLYYVAARIGKERILSSQDPHFNDIPLSEWDAMIGVQTKHQYNIAAFLLAKEVPCIATFVCIFKAAARQIKEESEL